MDNPKWADLLGADPDYTDGKPVDEWLEERHSQLPDPLDTKCPFCGAEAYECDAPHTDGRRYLHCRRFSAHNVELRDDRLIFDREQADTPSALIAEIQNCTDPATCNHR